MEKFWDRIKQNLNAGMKTVSRKTEELTRIGKLKLEIVAVKRDIEKAFIELGGRLYHRIDQDGKYDTKDDPDILSLVEKIRGYEDKLESLEKKIKDIQEVSRSESTGDV